MRKIYIDNTEEESRIAVVEDDDVVELVHESRSKKIVAGSIYAGRIKNILPTRFAFVDIGDERNAFLYLNDHKENWLYTYDAGKSAPVLTVRQGDTIPVQVLKEASRGKGAVVTSQLSFPGKFAVLIYKSNEIGVSKKITDKTERDRLKHTAKKSLPDGYGVIMRTKCESLSEEKIEDEIKRLVNICEATLQKITHANVPDRIYESLSAVIKIIRDLFDEVADKIIVNDEAYCKNLKRYVENDAVLLYEGEVPMFENYLIENQIEKALNKKVWLKSGGFIVIEQTEACVTIDVNTGKFTGKTHEQTVLTTNMEAGSEIAKQLRLRNLSGIIIIDFIDMQEQENKKIIQEHLREQFKDDRAGVNIIGMSGLGLMQLTRKKTGESLENTLMTECPCCHGRGRVMK